MKNNQARVVPISDELREKLLPFIEKRGICFPVHFGVTKGEKYNKWGPQRVIRRVLKKAGVDKEGRRIGWHEFRHTFASQLAQKGVSLYKISKWLGHSDISTTQIYAHFAPIYDGDIERLSLAGSAGCLDGELVSPPK